MKVISDQSVRVLRNLLAKGKSLRVAAERAEMDEKSARKYRSGALPSQRINLVRQWRTRENPFADVWDEVANQLQTNPKLKAKTILDWLQEKYPDQFDDGQLRTLQRRIRHWHVFEGSPKEVFFSQVHHPGLLGASDFTTMNSLGVTIAGQQFDHMVFHFVLTYSNWETASVCFSESFESLSDGLQQALWKLGGVPKRHRTDRMSAAVTNPSQEKEFTRRYKELMDHYGLQAEKINPRQAHENGDCEQSHYRFKDAVDQALMMRQSRDFPNRDAYERFLDELVHQRNSKGQKVLELEQERAALRPLPAVRLDSFQRLSVRVDQGSTIHVNKNIYSVNSRLIGEKVDVYVYADHLKVWFAGRMVGEMPRLRGRGKHAVNYRHVIDWLVRKPGAFENYVYRDELFPTSHFRMAYDWLYQAKANQASREYLGILEVAAKESESLVDSALRALLDQDQVITVQAVKDWMERQEPARPSPDVRVELKDLSCFDMLFNDKESWNDASVRSEAEVDGSASGASLAHVS